MSRSPRQAVLAALAVALAGAEVLSAMEYFVSKAGDDRANGRALQRAFATIAKGVATLKPGDTLTILPGVYFESVSARLSGAPGAPITIRAWRPGTVLMRGDVDVTGFRRVEGMRYTYALDFKRRVEGVSERGAFRTYGPTLSVAEVEESLASFYQDPKTGRLYVHTSDSGHPDKRRLCLSVTDGFGLLITPPGRGFVRDVTIDGLAFTGYRTREFPKGPGSRARWGLHVVRGERVTVRRCVAFLNDGGLYLLACRDSLVEDCYAFGNHSRFLDLGNNILGWSVINTTFRNNRAEGFWKGSGASNDDIAFYGGGKGLRGAMQGNLAVNAGLMIKGPYSPDTVQEGNVVVGRGAYIYRKPDATNILLRDNEGPRAKRNYVDPANHDYRLQSDAPLRGKGPDGKDPGPFPYRDEVFFVSPNGNDAARGTSLKQAWRTLGHAAAKARPGDTVYVLEGEYRESLAPARSGEPGKPIRFLRYGRDRVVLNGEGRREAGLDLTDRSHVEVKGFVVREFTRHGLLARRSGDVRAEQILVLGAGGDAVLASESPELTFTHNLTRGSRGAGLRLDRSPRATVTGNVFDVGAGPRLAVDAPSLQGIWSDANAFPPGETLFVAGERRHASLAAWRKATGLDPTSLATEAGYLDPEPERADFALRGDSPLIGRGPLASVIGPYLRLRVGRPLPVEHVRTRSVTDTTANLEWWTPTANVATTLVWGKTPKPANVLATPRSALHTVGLTGLKPGVEYHFQVKPKETYLERVFAPYRLSPKVSATPADAETYTFRTAATRPAARVFHVSPKGANRRSGLTTEDAWRTIAHAAEKVRAGDTVLIHAGQYEEFVPVKATGDAGAPITFRAAPGEGVWMDGSKRSRATAFQISAKRHIHLDGLRFRHYRYVPHAGDPIHIEGGSHHVIRRCFHDGRERSGYVGNFIRANNTSNLLIENCVMINGMGHGLILVWCPEAEIRHCVFYNNFIRAMSVMLRKRTQTLTLSHNLFCANLPQKTGNPLIRTSDLMRVRSDYNGFFCRLGPEKRHIYEVFAIGGKGVGRQGGGSYRGGKRFRTRYS